MTTRTFEQDRGSGLGLAFPAASLIAGAALQFVLGFPLAHLQASAPVPTTILLLNALSHVLLGIGVVGLARSGATGPGGLGRAGIGLTLLGLAVLTLAEFVAVSNMEAAVVFYSVSTLAIALGLIVAGIAVVRAGRWTGWHRLTPLLCGLFIPAVLLPAFALPGYASHYAIGAWGVCWLLLGLAMRAESAPM